LARSPLWEMSRHACLAGTVASALMLAGCGRSQPEVSRPKSAEAEVSVDAQGDAAGSSATAFYLTEEQRRLLERRAQSGDVEAMHKLATASIFIHDDTDEGVIAAGEKYYYWMKRAADTGEVKSRQAVLMYLEGYAPAILSNQALLSQLEEQWDMSASDPVSE
jgi:TPR repeat protein